MVTNDLSLGNTLDCWDEKAKKANSRFYGKVSESRHEKRNARMPSREAGMVCRRSKGVMM